MGDGDLVLNNIDLPPGATIIENGEEYLKSLTEPDKTAPELPPGATMQEQPLYLNLMPDDPVVKDKFTEMINKAENPREEKAKIANALYLNKKYGIDLSYAYDNQGEIIQWWTGKEISPDDFLGRLGNSWKAGELNVQIGKLRSKQLIEYITTGKLNEDITNQINELKKQMPAQNLVDAGIPEQALNYAAGQLPIWLTGAKRGIELGLPMGVGGAIMAAGYTPTGPLGRGITSAAAFTSLFSVGMTYGMLESIGTIEAGLSFDEMLDLGIDPDIAAAASLGVGVINAGLEMVQFKGIIEPFKAAIKGTSGKVMRSGVLKSLAKSAMQYGASVGEETLQEIAQESVNITFDELAKVWMNEARKKNIPYADAKQIFNRLKDTAYQSALGFAALQLPGHTMKTITGGEKGEVSTTAAKKEAPAGKAVNISEKEIATQEPETPRIEKESIRAGKIEARVARVSQDYQEHIDYFEKVIKKAKEGTGEELKTYVSELKNKKAELEDIARGITDSKNVDIAVHLEETENRIQEQESIAEKILPHTPEELVSTLKSVGLEHVDLQWFAEKDMSRIWHSAADKVSKGGELSEVEINRLLNDIRKNPTKFQRLFAELSNNKEVIKALDKIESLELQEKDVIENTTKKAVIKHIDEMKDKIRAATQIAKRLEIAKEVRDAREKMAILTGKHTIGELLTEEKVESAIKAVPRTVKKALSEGKKEGVITERLRKKNLLEKAAAKKKLKEYVRNLARKITRPPAHTIDFYYRQAVETIQSGIDPKFRTKKTLQAREKLSAFLKEHPEARENISKKVLDTLSKKALNDMTVADLEDIYSEVQRLKQLGRLKKSLKKVQEARRFEALKTEFINIVTKGKGLEDVVGQGKATGKEGIGKKLLGAHLIALRPMRMFDLFDGGKNFRGPMHEFFYNRANTITDNEYRAIDERIKKVDLQQKELGIKANELFKTKEIDGIKYSVDEIMDIYCAMKNPLKREAVIYGNNLTEAQAWEFISTLSDKEKTYADYIIQEYEDNYERLREAHIAYKDEDLGKEINYTPVIRKDIDYDGLEIDIAKELSEQANLKRAYAKRGFTKGRIKISPAHQKPIRLGLLSTWTEQVHKQEHYIHGAQIIKELQRMANDKEFSQALRQRYGKEAVKLTKDYVNRVANPNIYKSFDSISKVSRLLRQHTAIAYLAYNGVTMIKQLPSVALYLPYSGPGHLISSAFKTALRPMQTVEMIEKLDPQMKHRSLERFTEELQQADKSRYDRIIKKIGRTGMAGIYFMDKVATTIGWQAVYDKCLKQGLSEEEAVTEARNATLRTQPAAHAKDIAKLYATNEGFNWLLMFSNQLNQIYNMITYDLPMQLKIKKFGQAVMSALGLGLSGLMIWAISKKRLPEDEEDVGNALADQALNSIPLIGKEIVARRQGWVNTGIPGIQAIQNLGSAVDIKDEELRVKWRNILEALAISLGVPYTGPKRVIKTAATGEPAELIGGKAKEKKKKK